MDEIYVHARLSNQMNESKIYVYSDSVLCLGKMQEHSEVNQKWKDQLEEFRQSNSYRIDGEPIEFEEYFPMTYFTGHPREDPEPENFEERISFVSMFNDIDWMKRGNSKRCIPNSEQVKNYAKRFSRGHWTFPGPGDEKKLYGTPWYTLEGKCDSVATEMVGRFEETGHPVVES